MRKMIFGNDLIISRGKMWGKAPPISQHAFFPTESRMFANKEERNEGVHPKGMIRNTRAAVDTLTASSSEASILWRKDMEHSRKKSVVTTTVNVPS